MTVTYRAAHPPVIGVDIALDLSMTSVATATREGRLVRIRLEYLAGADNARIVAGLAGRSQVVLSTAGPSDTMTAKLKRAGVKVVELNRREAELAENSFAIELFKAQKAKVRLPNDELLKEAVKHARMRRTRAGNLLDKLLSASDLAPFTACAYAFLGMTRGKQRAPRIYGLVTPDEVRERWRREDAAWDEDETPGGESVGLAKGN